MLSEDLIRFAVDLANKKNVPTTADPKKKNFHFYKGVTLFKPNLKEINEALGVDNKGGEIDEISNSALEFIQKNSVINALITLSEFGAVLVNEKEQIHVKAHLRNIRDVSGAGDTVISVASAFLAIGLDLNKILNYSNLAGGLVCEQVGVVSIDKNHLKTQAVKL